MKVKELRHLLFDVKDQKAEVVVVTKSILGSVIATKSVTGVGHSEDPKGFVRLQIGG